MARVAPISLQQSFWNRWNASYRAASVGEVSRRQAEVVCGWLASLGRQDLDMMEVGCGTGWFCPQLTRFGRVTATDLADEVLARARHRAPEVRFVDGDFMNLDFGSEAFDVIVTLEVLSHVADQRAFVKKLAGHLRPGGHLMLATQNRFVLQHLNFIPPPAAGQNRRWVDRRELRDLLEPELDVLQLCSVTPRVGGGFLRWIDWRELVRTAVGGRLGGDRTRTAGRVGAAVRVPRWLEACLEASGLGWTLMALARKRRTV